MPKQTIFCGILIMLALLFVAQCSRNNLELVEVTRPAPASALNAPANTSPTLVPATSSTATGTPAPQNLAPASTPPDTPAEVIRRAMMAQFQVPRERITNKLVSADGSISESVMEYIAPKNFHIRTDSMEMIMVEGKGAWMKQDGEWKPAPAALAETFASARDPQKIEQLLRMVVWSDAKFVGAELLNGKPMWVYSYTTVFQGMKQNGGDIHSSNKLWVGAADGLPHKLVSESESFFSDTGKEQMEQMHEYDIAFTIEPPI